MKALAGVRGQVRGCDSKRGQFFKTRLTAVQTPALLSPGSMDVRCRKREMRPSAQPAEGRLAAIDVRTDRHDPPAAIPRFRCVCAMYSRFAYITNPAARVEVIIGPIISKQRNLGLITVLRHHMTKAPKSKWRDLSSRMSSRDPVIRIFDFRPPGVSRALPRWHVGSGFRHFGQFRRINGWGEENLAKVSTIKIVSGFVPTDVL